jgi:hypothetical protein
MMVFTIVRSNTVERRFRLFLFSIEAKLHAGQVSLTTVYWPTFDISFRASPGGWECLPELRLGRETGLPPQRRSLVSD